MGLPANLTTGIGIQGGGVRGGSQVNFQSSVVHDIAAEIANDETNHILFLRSTLGSKAVAEPVISLDYGLHGFCGSCGIAVQLQSLPRRLQFPAGGLYPHGSRRNRLSGRRAFHYEQGQSQCCSRILAAEAYHIGSIRTLLFAQQNIYYTDATALISALRAKLSGALDDQGIGADQSTIDGGFPSPSNITNTDANSINFARTPRQVLNVVYGASGAQKGGFFPDGANGGPEFEQLLKATNG